MKTKIAFSSSDAPVRPAAINRYSSQEEVIMANRKQKARGVLLLLLTVMTAIMGCETDVTGDDYGDIPIFERVWTYPAGITMHITTEKTVTISRLPLTGTTQNDYRGVCIVHGKYLEVTLTHSKAETGLEYQRLSQPLLLYAVYQNGNLDILPYENVNTGYVNAPGNASITDTVWVFSVPVGSTLHMGNKSVSITRLGLSETSTQDYAGTYAITSKKFVEICLLYAKHPEEKQMERMRIGVLIYAIYNETTPPTLNLYTGAILSTGYYVP